jgi:hypothetical protein
VLQHCDKSVPIDAHWRVPSGGWRIMRAPAAIDR